jgi:hypothetical protein
MPTEQLLTPQDIAKALSLPLGTVTRVFQDVPGVLKTREKRKNGRYVTTIQIPCSVFDRWYAEHSK